MKKVLLALLMLGCASIASAQLGNRITLTVIPAGTKVSGPQLAWPGGMGVMDVVGTWNGATVTLEYVGSDGTTLQTVGSACIFTQNGNCAFYLPAVTIQAVVSGAGGSTSLTATVGG